MTFDPDKHGRRSVRLPGYDYSQPGAYFVTVCARDRECLFGDVLDGEMTFNDAGRIINECWHDLPDHYPYVALDAFVLMPNHIHAVILIMDTVGAGLKPARTRREERHALPEIVRGFKTFSARRINLAIGRTGQPVWQRNYYEHVIRNERDLDSKRQYIVGNPAKWQEDPDNPRKRSGFNTARAGLKPAPTGIGPTCDADTTP